MAWTPSSMPELGTSASDFSLPDAVGGGSRSLLQLRAEKATVVMFLSNRSPCVRHIREALLKLAHDYRARGAAFIAINSGDAETYPEDAPEQMRAIALRHGFPFPYLYDESQDVARAYGATCTPDFFVYDGRLRLAYRGRFDQARPDNDVPVSGRDLRAAVNALVSGKPVDPAQQPSLGCPIQWRVYQRPLGARTLGFLSQTMEPWR